MASPVIAPVRRIVPPVGPFAPFLKATASITFPCPVALKNPVPVKEN